MKTKQQKKDEAERRNAQWGLLTPMQQLHRLSERGCIAVRQRARLLEKIEKERKDAAIETITDLSRNRKAKR